MAVRPRLLDAVRDFTVEELRGDAPWGWVYMTLHGHYLDHLGVLEPWAGSLRARQADGDPFTDDPRAMDHADFVAQVRHGKSARESAGPCFSQCSKSFDVATASLGTLWLYCVYMST